MDNMVELAAALAAAVQARLPQSDLGDLAADLAHALGQDRTEEVAAGRSAILMARVSACLPARLIMETRLGAGPQDPASEASLDARPLRSRSASSSRRRRPLRRTHGLRVIAAVRARTALKPPGS